MVREVTTKSHFFYVFEETSPKMNHIVCEEGKADSFRNQFDFAIFFDTPSHFSIEQMPSARQERKLPLNMAKKIYVTFNKARAEP